MAKPKIEDLKLWVGTLITKDEWDYNFTKIASWFSDGDADLVVNTLKATNGLDLDGATINNVGNATEENQAINLGQAQTLLNRSTKYYPFSIASGLVTDGEAAYLQKNSNTQLTVLAGNVNPDLVVVQSDGTIESVTSNVILTIPVSDGTYHIIKEKGQTITITAGANNKVTIGREQPVAPAIGDYFLNNSVVPFKGRKYTADGWEDVDFCWLGDVVVSDSATTVNVKTFNYNNNYFDVIIKEKYINGTEGYIVYTDNYCEQWGNIADANPAVTVTFLKEFANADYNVTLGGKGKASSSDVYVLEATDRTATQMTVKYRWESVDWRACGYIK